LIQVSGFKFQVLLCVSRGSRFKSFCPIVVFGGSPISLERPVSRVFESVRVFRVVRG
jgi:hypothetical protein